MNTRSRAVLPVILGMTIVVVGLVYGLLIRPNFYRIVGGNVELDAIAVTQLNTGLDETVSHMGDFLYVASKEGLTKYDKSGESIWNKSYHIDDILFIVEEPYMAVIHLAGKRAYVFNEDGLVGQVQTDYMIVGGTLNAEGYLSLTLENENENYICLYDANGELAIERRTLFKKDGYPIATALSSDGTKMMTSHLDISQHNIASTITFLDFSSDGKEFEDRVVGHERLSEVMATSLVVIGEDTGVVIGDAGIYFYKMTPTPALINHIEVNARINHIAHTEDQLVISYGEALVPEGTELANAVVIYSAEGIQESVVQVEEEVTGLTSEDETFYVILSSKVMSYKSGRKQWESTLYKQVRSIESLGGDQYLLIFDYNYEIMEIRDM